MTFRCYINSMTDMNDCHLTKNSGFRCLMPFLVCHWLTSGIATLIFLDLFQFHTGISLWKGVNGSFEESSCEARRWLHLVHCGSGEKALGWEWGEFAAGPGACRSSLLPESQPVTPSLGCARDRDGSVEGKLITTNSRVCLFLAWMGNVFSGAGHSSSLRSKGCWLDWGWFVAIHKEEEWKYGQFHLL